MRDGTRWDGRGGWRWRCSAGHGLPVLAVTGNEFWFAPPDVSDLHNVPGEPSTWSSSRGRRGAHVVIDPPANAAFTPIHGRYRVACTPASI